MHTVIKRVQSSAEMDDFISLPGRIAEYRTAGYKVADTHLSYSPENNPVHRHLKTAYFVAYAGNTPVGRVAAIKDLVNPSRDTGFFGCFECKADSGAASLLVESAQRWLKKNGCPRMIGPATFNTNQKVGFLLQGDPGLQPNIPYNPFYYNHLMEKAGLRKHTDLYSFKWLINTGLSDKIREKADRAGKIPGISIRPISRGGSGAALVRHLFNRSMYGNWGFIPLTAAESGAILKYCSACADPDLMVTAWYRGTPAGIFIFLPGGLTQAGTPGSIRAAVAGVLPRFRREGLVSYMSAYLVNILNKKGYSQVDISLVHEDNNTVLHLLSITGAKVTGVFRVYEFPGKRSTDSIKALPSLKASQFSVT